jgi:hypothetical protein
MRLMIDNAMDGDRYPAFPGKVLIDGERIAAIAPQSGTLPPTERRGSTPRAAS